MSIRIYAGYNKEVRVFDLDRPGRVYQEYSTVPVRSNRAQTRVVTQDYSLNGVTKTYNYCQAYNF